MAAAKADYTKADSQRVARVDALDQEAVRLRGRLARVVNEQLDAPSGSETAPILREKAEQIESMLRRLQAERAQLATLASAGLSDEQMTELARFAAEVRSGIDQATDLERRRVLQLLQMHGHIRHDDEHGIRLAKRNRYSVNWEAVLHLRRSEMEFTNSQTVWIGPAVEASAVKSLAAE